MKRYLFSYIALIALIEVQAQWIISPIRPVKASLSGQRTLQQKVTPLELPFWDDFSESENVPDTNRWEVGQDVYVNRTMAKNERTLNVATFDGLRGNGQAHQLGADYTGAGDSLVSLPIDLSRLTIADSVFFSFFWQAQGWGELPDKDDSLKVEFLAKSGDSLVWEWKWAIGGGLETVNDKFQFEDFFIEESRFLHDQFRFRFISISTLSGPFDAWHIDYVYLNKGRNFEDSIFVDRSIIKVKGNLFDSYVNIPIEAARSQNLLNQQVATISNQLNNALQPTENFTYQLRNENSNQLIYENIRDGEFLPANSIGEVPSFTSNDISVDFNSITGDSIVLSSRFFYFTKDTFHYETPKGIKVEYPTMNLRVNDTLKTYYTLHNYYSYDDGTAEFAAGLNSTSAQVAIKYGLYQPDTLTHIDIYFPSIAPSAVGKTIQVKVWSNLDQDALITVPHVIGPPKKMNDFSRIELPRPIVVQDTFFIGYQQFIDNYVGIGLDRSNPGASSRMYSNDEGFWVQNTRLSGILMIRPVFEEGYTVVLSNESFTDQSSIKIYPVPSSGVVHLSGTFETIRVFDLLGKEVFRGGYQKQFDFHFLTEGLYLVNLTTNSQSITQKMIIKK